MQDHVRIISVIPSLLPQHNPWPYRPGQPAPRTGLPEERRGSLHSFRQMDKSAEHTQPSDCEQAHMMAHQMRQFGSLNTLMYAYHASKRYTAHILRMSSNVRCFVALMTGKIQNVFCICSLLSFHEQQTNASIKVQMCAVFSESISIVVINISKR